MLKEHFVFVQTEWLHVSDIVLIIPIMTSLYSDNYSTSDKYGHSDNYSTFCLNAAAIARL